MDYTKHQIIDMSLNEIGYDYTYPVSPEKYQYCLRRLDSMMGQWAGEGIDLGYTIPNTPDDSDIEDVVTLGDWVVNSVCLNLSLLIAPSFGRVVSPDTRMNAFDSKRVVFQKSVLMPEMEFQTELPMGQGNKHYYTFYEPPAEE